jgi:hypothetical protein
MLRKITVLSLFASMCLLGGAGCGKDKDVVSPTVKDNMPKDREVMPVPVGGGGGASKTKMGNAAQ